LGTEVGKVVNVFDLKSVHEAEGMGADHLIHVGERTAAGDAFVEAGPGYGIGFEVFVGFDNKHLSFIFFIRII
jgi:hypothetical protein